MKTKENNKYIEFTCFVQREVSHYVSHSLPQNDAAVCCFVASYMRETARGESMIQLH